MRPQLFVAGLAVLVTGGILYALGIFADMGLAFVGGGIVLSVASFLVPEGPGPLTPPEGFRFCVFCTTLVPLSSERCPRCNGLQPKGGG